MYDWTPAENDPTDANNYIEGLLDIARADRGLVMDSTVCLPENFSCVEPVMPFTHRVLCLLNTCSTLVCSS